MATALFISNSECILPAERQPLAVRNTQYATAFRTKIQTPLTQITLQLPHTDAVQFLFAMGAYRNDVFTFFEIHIRNHFVNRF